MAVAIKTYKVELEGQTPLLMHRDDIDWADRMKKWETDPGNKALSVRGDDRSPAWRWIGYCYHDGETLCMSSDNLSRCVMEGGGLVPTGKGTKTFKAQTQSGMKVDEMWHPLLVKGKAIPWAPVAKLMKEDDFAKHVEAVKKMGFTLFTKRVRNPSGKTKHVRVRPRMGGWSLTFTVSVWDKALTVPILESIFTNAGAYKGLADWRPGSATPGPYGIFRLKSLREA